jgi:hypothetical protein
MTALRKSFKPKNPINIRTPEYRQRREKTKKERLNRQREREAKKEIRDWREVINPTDIFYE